MSPSTLVVGGGLAGLLAARRHLRAGHTVVLEDIARRPRGTAARRPTGPCRRGFRRRSGGGDLCGRTGPGVCPHRTLLL